VQSFGVHDFKWASDPQTALFTVVLVDVWVYTPFIMILLLAGLRSLPKQPFEAAALDGVPRRFVFTRITLPMLMPYIVTAALFRLLDSIQQFDIIYPMTQGGPEIRCSCSRCALIWNSTSTRTSAGPPRCSLSCGRSPTHCPTCSSNNG